MAKKKTIRDKTYREYIKEPKIIKFYNNVIYDDVKKYFYCKIQNCILSVDHCKKAKSFEFINIKCNNCKQNFEIIPKVSFDQIYTLRNNILGENENYV